MRLLLVEDKDSFRRLLIQALADSAWSVTAVGDPVEAFAALQRSPFEVMVTDLRLPGFSGLELLKRAKRIQPGLRVVLMSAFGEPHDIVEAMRWGAEDFLPKPFDLDRFLDLLERLRALVGAPPPDPREPWISHSPSMRALDDGLARAAESHVPVLFLGERGVGRARAARRLHSLRHPGAPFLSLAPESLGPDDLESGRLSLLKSGSVFLPDLEGLPESSVPGLLRAMDSPEGQALHWSGSAQNWADLPERLRERLGVLSFTLLPLRERSEDTLPLFRAFLVEAARTEGRPVPLIERNAERELLKRPWAGNARELLWCVSLAVRSLDGAILGNLPHLSLGCGGSPMGLPWPAPGSLEAMLANVEKNAVEHLLRRALAAHEGGLLQTAAALGITPRTLSQRLREHHIPIEELR